MYLLRRFLDAEWSNSDRWKNGTIGGKIFVQTKLARWRERRADAELKDAFLENWTAQDGARLEIQPEKISLTLGENTTEFSQDVSRGSVHPVHTRFPR